MHLDLVETKPLFYSPNHEHDLLHKTPRSHYANGDTGEKFYLTATEPDYKSLIDNPGLRRRMSRIIKMGVAAAQMCLKEDTLPEAIVTATVSAA